MAGVASGLGSAVLSALLTLSALTVRCSLEASSLSILVKLKAVEESSPEVGSTKGDKRTAR